MQVAAVGRRRHGEILLIEPPVVDREQPHVQEFFGLKGDGDGKSVNARLVIEPALGQSGRCGGRHIIDVGQRRAGADGDTCHVVLVDAAAFLGHPQWRILDGRSGVGGAIQDECHVILGAGVVFVVENRHLHTVFSRWNLGEINHGIVAAEVAGEHHLTGVQVGHRVDALHCRFVVVGGVESEWQFQWFVVDVGVLIGEAEAPSLADDERGASALCLSGGIGALATQQIGVVRVAVIVLGEQAGRQADGEFAGGIGASHRVGEHCAIIVAITPPPPRPLLLPQLQLHIGPGHRHTAIGLGKACDFHIFALDKGAWHIGERDGEGGRFVLAHIDRFIAQMISQIAAVVQAYVERSVHAVGGNGEGSLHTSKFVGGDFHRVDGFTVSVGENQAHLLTGHHAADSRIVALLLVNRHVVESIDHGRPFHLFSRPVDVKVGVDVGVGRR